MPQVETARGPIETAKLGKVLMHEHVFIISTEIAQNYPEDWGDEDVRLADAVKRLNELRNRRAGCDARRRTRVALLCARASRNRRTDYDAYARGDKAPARAAEDPQRGGR